MHSYNNKSASFKSFSIAVSKRNIFSDYIAISKDLKVLP